LFVSWVCLALMADKDKKDKKKSAFQLYLARKIPKPIRNQNNLNNLSVRPAISR